MVDSRISLPRVDPNAYPTLQETIQSLDRGYRMGNVSFDERSSNFPQPTGLPVIPGIHIPFQVDDRTSRDILYGQGDSPDAVAEQDSKPEEGHAERATAGALASTSTSAGGHRTLPMQEGLEPRRDRRGTSISFPRR